MKETTKERDKSIDILKGIGILFVILGHMNQIIPKNLLIYIYSFHMPLFFYISGYLYKDNYQMMTFKEYLEKRARQLLYPYLTLSIINFLWLTITKHSMQIGIKFILSFLYSNYIFDTNYIGAVWFLMCLFTVEILYYIIEKNLKKYDNIVVAILLGIGVVLKNIIDINYFRLPFWSDIALFAIVFYHIGFLVKKHKSKTKYKINSKIFFAIIFIIINIVGIIANSNYCNAAKSIGRPDMLYLCFGNYLYFFLAAFSGIFTWQIVSEIISENKVLELFGQNTLIIMGIHIIILQIVMKISKIIINSNIYLQIGVNFVIIAIVSLGGSLIIKKFIPKLISLEK